LEVVLPLTFWYANDELPSSSGKEADSPQMYTRASASDYDDFQAKGWSTKELLPLMKKHETYQRACHNKYGFSPWKVV
jgi:hypothetical protein